MRVPGPDDLMIALADKAGLAAQDRLAITLPTLLRYVLVFDQATWFAVFAAYVTKNMLLGAAAGLYALWMYRQDRNRLAQLVEDGAKPWTEPLAFRYARAAEAARDRHGGRRTLSLLLCLGLVGYGAAQGVAAQGWLPLVASLLFWAGKIGRYYGECVLPLRPQEETLETKSIIRARK